MAQTSVVTLAAPTAAVGTAVCAAQTVTLTATINGSLATGGIATLDMARRVYLQSAGNDSTLNWTVYGTDRYGKTISEVLAGGSGATVNTANDFKTVTTLSLSGTSAGTVTVGTGAIASSAWVPVNRLARVMLTYVAVDGVTGKVTVEKACSQYDPAIYAASNNGAVLAASAVDIDPVTNMTTLTADSRISDTAPAWAYRLSTVTLNTTTVTLTIMQGDL